MTIKKALAAASVTALSVLFFSGMAGTAAATSADPIDSSSADSISSSEQGYGAHLVIGNASWDVQIPPLAQN